MARVATVFGGSGFVGRYIVKRLAREGWVVRVAARDPGRAHFLQPLGNVGQIVRLGVAIQDEAAVKRSVEGADAVFNCTGILHEPGGRQTFEELHHRGPARIAKAAAEAGVRRLIHISAIGADSRSDSMYARSKGLGEKALLKAFPDATILRPSLVIGPEDGFFNRFAVMARLSPVLPLIGGGHTRFQPVYVGDLADAAMKALHEPAAKGKMFELGGPRTYTFKQLMELLLKEIHRRRILLPVPYPVAEAQAAVLELLPQPLLTRDQITMLKKDNVVSKKRGGTFEDLGLRPQAIEVMIPAYLERYRPGGRFQAAARRGT